MVLGLGIAALSYTLVGAAPTSQGNNNTSATVPAPGPNQKKVVLKNLGMA